MPPFLAKPLLWLEAEYGAQLRDLPYILACSWVMTAIPVGTLACKSLCSLFIGQYPALRDDISTVIPPELELSFH